MSGTQKQNQNKQSQSTEKRNKPKVQSVHQVNPDQLRESPETLKHADVLAAQKQLGNQVVQRALNKPGKPDASLNQQNELDEKTSKEIQQKRGSGGSLPADFRKESEAMLGADFSDVRVHTDDRADKLSRAISARAFTIGKDIFFKRGVFSPTSSRGRETLIHELTHVIQQSGSTSKSGKLKLGKPDTAQEKEAAKIGKQGAAKQSGLGMGALPQVQRQASLEEEELLQGEPDTLQRLEEEELLQGEPDTLQRTEEEEEMLQAEPDTLQREITEEDRRNLSGVSVSQRRSSLLTQSSSSVPSVVPPAPASAIPPAPAMPPAPAPAVKAHGSTKKSFADELKSRVEERNTVKENKSKMLQELSGQKNGLISRAKKQKSIKSLDEKLEQKRQANIKGEAQDAKNDRRNKLVQTIQNPKSSSEDVQKAQEELNSLHKRGMFKKGFASQAMDQRKNALKKAAERGDEGAFEKYKEHKAANPSTKSKIGGLMKKGGGMAFKGLQSVGKGAFNKLKEHYLGKSEDPAPAAAPAPAAQISIGGGGMADMMEKYADLKQENQELKKKLEEKGG